MKNQHLSKNEPQPNNIKYTTINKNINLFSPIYYASDVWHRCKTFQHFDK